MIAWKNFSELKAYEQLKALQGKVDLRQAMAGEAGAERVGHRAERVRQLFVEFPHVARVEPASVGGLSATPGVDLELHQDEGGCAPDEEGDGEHDGDFDDHGWKILGSRLMPRDLRVSKKVGMAPVGLNSPRIFPLASRPVCRNVKRSCMTIC